MLDVPRSRGGKQKLLVRYIIKVLKGVAYGVDGSDTTPVFIATIPN